MTTKTEPTTVEIREWHEGLTRGGLKYAENPGPVPHEHRGILLDRLEAAETDIETSEVEYRKQVKRGDYWQKQTKEAQSRIKELEGAGRPQYCVCNEHPWLTAISKRATFECPACKVKELEAKLEQAKGFADGLGMTGTTIRAQRELKAILESS